MVNIRPTLVAAAALVLVLTGCRDASSTPAAAKPATVKPARETLLASIPQRSSVPFHFAVSGGDDEMSGVIDGRHNSGDFDMVNDFPSAGYTLDINALVLDRKAWVKLSYKKARPGHALPKQWLAVDYDKAVKLGGGPYQFSQENDPGLVTQAFVYASDLRTTGPGQISGTTDMTSMSDGGFLRRDHFEALGSGAHQVPFTVVLDDQGRLSSLSLRIPAGGKFAATTYKVAYTDYGSAALPEPPAAGDQIPAPDGVYQLFTGAQYAGPDVG